MVISVSELIRASARGGQTYHASRHKIATRILASPSSAIAAPNSFLLERLFKLDKSKWIVLGFNKKDWMLLDAIATNRDETVRENYERLLADYITINADRVQRLYDLSSKISAAILQADDGESVAAAAGELDEVDRQSLFSFRVYAAQRGHSNDLLLSYFKAQMSTDWLKKRFLYPFVYYVVNNDADRNRW